jgi:cation:H+ antiporter
VSSSLFLTLAILLGSAAAIYLACEYFVNGIEWVGRKLAFGQTATASILAAIGTALPESVITFIAVVFGHTPEQRNLGVGAALGGPLVLATIAYAVVGLTLILTRQHLPATPAIRREFRRLSRDQAWFLIVFAAKVILGVVVFVWKPWLGVLFVVVYGVFFWQEMRGEEQHAEEQLEPLKFAPKRSEPAAWQVYLQTLLALAVIFAASRLFVDQLDVLGPQLGMPPQLLALLLSPIATELPETMNAVLWVRQGKHRLALANISGSMMIQATVPTALGLFFTPWLFDRSLLVAAGATFAAILLMFWFFRRGRGSRMLLVSMALFYVAFVLVALVWM